MGYWYSGRCHTAISDAAQSAVTDMSRPVPFFDVQASGGVMYYSHGIQLPVCVYMSGVGQVASIQCSNKLLGRYSATGMSGVGISHTTVSPAGVLSTSVAFPSCDVQATESEQIAAVNALWPYVVGLIAVAWAAGFLRRLVIRWIDGRG